jgi:hypothetical protein
MTRNPNPSLPVDDRTLLRVLTGLHAAGVGFVLDRLPHDELALDPHEVVAYMANPEAFVAEAMGAYPWKITEAGRRQGGDPVPCPNQERQTLPQPDR